MVDTAIVAWIGSRFAPEQYRALVVGIPLALALAGGYATGDGWRRPAPVVLSVTLGMLMILGTDAWPISVLVLADRALAWLLLAGAVLAGRMVVSYALEVWRRGRHHVRKAALVVEDIAAPVDPALLDQLALRRAAAIGVDEVAADPTRAHFDGIVRRIRDRRVDVIVAPSVLPTPVLEAIADVAEVTGCELITTCEALAVPGTEPHVVRHGGEVVLTLNRPHLRVMQAVLKRGLDIAGALAGLVLLVPVFAVIAVAIKRASPGPVLFGHWRIGRSGRPFRCWKFRSMWMNAEEILARDPVLAREYLANGFKVPEDRDPRITPIGRFLRRTSLDELPQLINVLRGEMSLVGPRPIVPPELAHYQERSLFFTSLKPGLTGLWAVAGRSTIGYPDRVGLELQYVREWSLGRDLEILWRTVPAVLSRRGAH